MTPDLRTTYLGLELSNPVVASASPLSGSLDTLRRLEEAGVGAVVLQSLFEEQIEHEGLHVHQVIAQWLAEREYDSVAQMRGSMSRRSVADPGDYERANYMRALTGYVVGR